ncbi:DUF3721 domain-containing protein [Cyanobium sp. Morenito 9A2]|nr:DUF3721 domain-containing protein [Cyanobium sp. Morenito 9A2]
MNTLPLRPHRGGHAALILVLSGALAVLMPPGAGAHMQGMFKTKAEAEKRAAELKCKGAFAMGSLWMPCANERSLHEALQKN